MKTLHISLSLLFICLFTGLSYAQKTTASLSKKETIKVWGECGMCKKTIEKAALSAGASAASWNKENKLLVVRYAANSTSSSKIEEAVAAAGYDTKSLVAPAAAYEALPACCHYQRKSEAEKAAMACCKDASCCKDGKCADGKCADMTACKEKGCCAGKDHAAMACCKDASCCKDGKCADGKCADMTACKEKGCCAGKDHAAMTCCKDASGCKDGKCADGKCADMAACKEKACCKSSSNH